MSGPKCSKYTVSSALAKMLADIGQAELRAYAFCAELNAALAQASDAASSRDLKVEVKARLENLIDELKSRHEQKTAIIREISQSQILSLEAETRKLINENKFDKAMALINENSGKQLKALNEIDDEGTRKCMAELRACALACAFCAEISAAIAQACDAASSLELTEVEKARLENLIDLLKSRHEQKTAIISGISQSQTLSLEETRKLTKEMKFDKAMAHISESSGKQLKALNEIDDEGTRKCIAASKELLKEVEDRIKREKTLLQQKQASSGTPHGAAGEHDGAAGEHGGAAGERGCAAGERGGAEGEAAAAVKPGGGAAMKLDGMDETLNEINEMLTECREVCSSLPEAEKEKHSVDSRLRQMDDALAGLTSTSEAEDLQRRVTRFCDKLDTIMRRVRLKQKRMEALVAQYKALHSELGISTLAIASPVGGAAAAASPLDIGGIEMYDEIYLKKQVVKLSGIRAKRREQAYIQNTIGALLEAEGCKLIGKSKEPGFMQQRLFQFGESSSVKITLASGGAISMEIIGLARGEREPTQEEVDALCSDMESFCGLYATIEKQLPMLGIHANSLKKEKTSRGHAHLEDISNYELTAEAQEQEENYIIDKIREKNRTPQTETIKQKYLG